MKSKSKIKSAPDLPSEWGGLPRMAFTRQPAPSIDDRDREDVAFGVQSADRLLNAFRVRERRLVKKI